MKQKDLVLILLVVAFSTVISLFVSKAIFSSPKNRQVQVDVVQPVTSEFPAPDPHYFNSNSFDPTKLITIAPNANPDPFSGTATQ